MLSFACTQLAGEVCPPPAPQPHPARGSTIFGRWWTVPDRMDQLVPAWFACRRFGVTKQTFAYWVSSGKLTPARHDSAGRPLYRYGDVAEVERQTRRSGKSRRGCRHHEPAVA